MSLKAVATETLEVLDRGYYITPADRRVDISQAQQFAVENTRLYRPVELAEQLAAAPAGEQTQSAILEVTDERTQEAARRLVCDEELAELAVLNFASARNVGGGFLTGAKAQEEDVARSCGLYRCLETQPEYYDTNRRNASLLYTDHLIYSPRVPWFRDRNREFLESCFLASIITAPAPNAGQHLSRHPNGQREIADALERRAAYVLAVAETAGHRNLLLGAWGCGVFRNDPVQVADIFLQHLASQRFAGRFDRVVFAVYDPAKLQPNLTAFRECVNRASGN